MSKAPGMEQTSQDLISAVITVVFSGVVTGRLNLPRNMGVRNYHGKEGCQAARTS